MIQFFKLFTAFTGMKATGRLLNVIPYRHGKVGTSLIQSSANKWTT